MISDTFSLISVFDFDSFSAENFGNFKLISKHVLPFPTSSWIHGPKLLGPDWDGKILRHPEPLRTKYFQKVSDRDRPRPKIFQNLGPARTIINRFKKITDQNRNRTGPEPRKCSTIGPDRTRTKKFLKFSDRSRINKKLRISD